MHLDTGDEHNIQLGKVQSRCSQLLLWVHLLFQYNWEKLLLPKNLFQFHNDMKSPIQIHYVQLNFNINTNITLFYNTLTKRIQWWRTVMLNLLLRMYKYSLQCWSSEAWTVCSLVWVFDSAQIYKLFRCDRLHPLEEEQAQWKFTESEMKPQMLCYILWNNTEQSFLHDY